MLTMQFFKKAKGFLGFILLLGFFIIPTKVFSEAMQTMQDNIALWWDERTLKTSWETWYPYSYLKEEGSPNSLTGLDIQLVKALVKDAKFKVDFQDKPWDKALEALKAGDLDFVSGATYSTIRAETFAFSNPYRYEEDALFVLRNLETIYTFNTAVDFVDYIVQHNFKLGVKKGAIFGDSHINAFINDPKNERYLVQSESDYESLEKLLDQEINGFLSDRIVGSSLVWHLQKGKLVSEKRLGLKTSIHLMFNKKTVSDQMMTAFNNAIEDIHHNDTYDNLISWYLYPAILLQTVEANWFIIIDILGTLFFSISGVLIANSINGSLLAAFIFALLPSLGGGLLRDVIFGIRPVDALSSPLYIGIVGITVLVGFGIMRGYNRLEAKHLIKEKSDLHQKIRKHLQLLLSFCDSLGLAAFTVTGVLISLMAKAEPLWLWGPFFAFLTGALGTIVRDILSKNMKIEDLEGELNSEIAIVWGLFLSIGLLLTIHNIEPDIIQRLVLVTIVGAFLTRLFVYFVKVPNVYFR